MKVFPYEVGFVSGMSDDEMMALAHDLEHSGWVRQEELIASAVEDYMVAYFRQRPSMTVRYEFPLMGPFDGNNDIKSPYVTRAYRSIQIRVPPAVSEPVARRLIECQVREQLSGDYDPRYRHEDAG